MKTAVEFYRTELNALVSGRKTEYKTESEIFEKALEMEKCRMIDFHVNCCEDGYNLESDKLLTEDVKLDIKAHAEQYFNKTFKSE